MDPFRLHPLTFSDAVLEEAPGLMSSIVNRGHFCGNHSLGNDNGEATLHHLLAVDHLGKGDLILYLP